jgi:hypothetical protein
MARTVAISKASVEGGTCVLVAVEIGTFWKCPHSGVSQAESKTRTINNKRLFCVFMDNSAVK